MKRLLILAGAAGVSLAATVAVASASGNPDPNNSQPASTQQVHKIAATPLDSATESKFTAIAPCRAANTNSGGGALNNGTQRSFAVGGSGSFTGQGGPSTGCGIPTQATAVSATITTKASGKGYLKAWAYGAGEPGTAFMNYTNSFLVATGGVIPVGLSGRINLKNTGGPTQVYLDITGYYMKPMTAHVNSNATFVPSSRATAVSKPFGAGTYQVTFDRSVEACTYSATSYSWPTSCWPSRGLTPDAVYVQGDNPCPVLLTDVSFYLSVTC